MPKPEIVDGVVTPNISRREFRTYDAIFDSEMESFPRQTFDLADEKERERFAAWLRHVVRRVAFDVKWAYRRATESALDQADTLMDDPSRYEKQKRRTKADRAKYEAQSVARKAEFERIQAERVENTRVLVEEGKLVAMPHLRFKKHIRRPKPKLVPDPEEPKE